MLKITCPDGSSVNTKIVHEETGTDVLDLAPVERVEIEIEAGEPTRAKLFLAGMQIDIAAAPRWYAKHPSGEYSEVSRIQFADGTYIEFRANGLPVVGGGDQ